MGSEGTSLTEAIRQTAGISLTKAVKDAAGRGPLVPEDGVAGEPSWTRGGGRALTQAPRAVPSKFAVLTMLLTLPLFFASFLPPLLPPPPPPPPHAPPP